MTNIKNLTDSDMQKSFTHERPDPQTNPPNRKRVEKQNMTKMLISEAIKWWFRQAEKLSDGSAKIFEEDNNRLAEEVAKLEAKLAAHLKNEGEECPLCKLEADNAALEQETEALGILLFNLVDVELERDTLQRQVEKLTEMTRGASYADFLWDECSAGNMTQEEMYNKLALEAGIEDD